MDSFFLAFLVFFWFIAALGPILLVRLWRCMRYPFFFTGVIWCWLVFPLGQCGYGGWGDLE